MGAYIKPIITKSDEGNIIRMRLVKANEKPSISYDELDVIKKEVVVLENHIRGIDKQIRITTALQNGNIKFPDEIHNISCKKTKAFLTDMENYIDVLNALPKAPLSIAEAHLKEIDLSSIPEPTPDQLEQIRQQLAYKRCQPLPNDTSGWESWDKGEIPFNQKDIEKITDEEAKEEYYNFERFKINKDATDKCEYEYIQNLTDKQLNNHYKSRIDSLLGEKLQWKNILDTLNKIIDAPEEYKGQPTYNHLLNGVLKKQSGTLLELRNKEKEDERNLLIDLIMNDNDLNEVQKLEALNNITNEDLDYEINRWLGKKLTKQERRILRVLRRIIYQIIEQQEITGIGKSIYEAEIPLSRIYEEYGLEKRECGSYDYNQTKIIQDILFGFSTKGLHEDILFKHTHIQKTRFILQIQEIKQKVLISKEKGKKIEPREVTQRIGIRIVVPHFLFVSDNKASSYYYQDTKGFKNFMAIKGVSQSEPAFNIAEYLEWFLSSKLKERSLDQSTLVEEGGEGFQKRYRMHRSEALGTIETILNNMVKAGYLIKGWQLRKGKYGQAQYTFENLRYELFIADKSKYRVIKSPINKTTKDGNNNNK